MAPLGYLRASRQDFPCGDPACAIYTILPVKRQNYKLTHKETMQPIREKERTEMFFHRRKAKNAGSAGRETPDSPVLHSGTTCAAPDTTPIPEAPVTPEEGERPEEKVPEKESPEEKGPEKESPEEEQPEVVAEWAGHLIMRHFVWVAVQVAKLYHDAFLVIESNTPESSGQSGFEMESVFDEIAEYYDNMYCRTPADQIVAGVPRRWGFHTNRSSKYMVCTHQQKVLAEDMYIERSIDAVDEHDTFEVKENGSLGAVEGCRDDRHITRAIGVWICYNELKPPVEIPDGQPRYSTARNIANESTL